MALYTRVNALPTPFSLLSIKTLHKGSKRLVQDRKVSDGAGTGVQCPRLPDQAGLPTTGWVSVVLRPREKFTLETHYRGEGHGHTHRHN